LVLPDLPLPPLDMILAQRGGDYRAWDWVATDPLVKSCFQQRQLALVSRPWTVEPGGSSALDRAAADSLKAQLDHIGWNRVTARMLYGLLYGFSVAETLYARDGGEIVLDQLKVRRQRRFCFDGTGRLRLRTLGAPFGMPLPDAKFWTFSCGSDHDDDPYGVGLCSWLYWPVWFRRGGLKAFLRYLEKYAQPTVIGTYPPTASEAEKDRLLEAAYAVASSTAVRLPEGNTIKLLEAARGGQANYGQLDDLMRDTITLVILSQTMTSHNGSSLSQAKVHEGVKLEVVQSDGEMIAESFHDGPATWLTSWNYPGAAVPVVRRIVEDAPDRAALANTDVALAGIGWRRTPEDFAKTFGDGYIYSPPVQPAPPAPGTAPADLDPAFAEPDGSVSPLNALLHAYVGQLADTADPAVAAMILEVRQLAGSCTTLEELRDQLLTLYPRLDVTPLAAALQPALTAADLAGRANAAGSE
jgi:phage gp29-like protein